MYRPESVNRWCVVAVLLVALVAFPASAAKDPFKGFDKWVEEIMAEWNVPGLGVAVVHDGEVLMARGYGYRNYEEKIPADGDTLFAIGSNTKSFTAALLGVLVDEGKLEWDEPVREYMPDFRLHDSVATEEMTARDLVCHRSGLPRHDLVWLQTGFSRTELYELLRHLEPTASFRSIFQYQNLMFMTAGILAERVAGDSWEDQVRRELLDPLGMVRSNFSVDTMQQDDNFSYAYGEEDDVIERIPFRNIDAIGPAGSINSSANEMAKYVQFHLDYGKVGDEQILSEANARAMQSPQMVLTGPLAARVSEDKEIGPASYGLGLMVSTYRGRPYVRHGGGIDGFVSAMEWLPEDRIGVVVLSNTSASGTVPSLIVRNVFDRLLGMEPIDWAERARKREKEAEEQAEKAKEEEASGRKEGTAPSHALEDYVGRYENPAYGVAEFTLEDGALTADAIGFTVPLEHYHYDIFAVPEGLDGVLEGFGGFKMTFYYNKQGDIDRVTLPLQPGLDDIEFLRLGDESMNDPAFLEKLTGDYTVAGTVVTVALQEDRLTMTVPGQPTYTLEPDRGTTFKLEGLDGFSVEFHLDEGADHAGALTSHQPNGSFRAERK
ncbi:MAG: serine hydrolase [Acidobacteria bacterium]|nr:serine hydrolase [Acidobacteriota bacterium]NIM62742.1 serine hydrolase [Acidobacteriota bacterium]NIO59042.1 serine hydrolase [Acidobacteriota bacterium]NIQ30081.1 serine hydrolase [Acidobacteriota bacterium]NIQ84884.1 serine hydrolase [Acidobacteriota bacterium]